MATPNIASVATITGVTLVGAATTGDDTIIDVTAEHTYKLNTILICNIDGTNSAWVTVTISIDNGSNYHAIAKEIVVPAASTLSLLDTPVYLDETDLLKIDAQANSDLKYCVSYEDILD